nr:hypothetical protein [uncultured Roseateles sp.]
MGPQRQLEDIDTPEAGLTAADNVLADAHPIGQFRLIESSLPPE